MKNYTSPEIEIIAMQAKILTVLSDFVPEEDETDPII